MISTAKLLETVICLTRVGVYYDLVVTLYVCARAHGVLACVCACMCVSARAYVCVCVCVCVCV